MKAVDRTVVTRFAEIARKHSELIAVQHKGAYWTYKRLDETSNQVARALLGMGIGQGQCVGLVAQRSIEAIVVCLGVLKAGGCYLPLDPSFPVSSLVAIATDARPAITITQGDGIDPALAEKAGRILDVGELLSKAAAETSANPNLELSGETPAYLMYTSGSTSRPKGVIVPHRGIVRLVIEPNFATFGPPDTMLEIGPIAFDFSTLEIFGMLLNGGRLAILADRVPSLAAIESAVKREGATAICLTPALFHLFVDHAIEALAPLNQIFVGGDVISVPHINRFRRRYPDCRLLNGYGPTENTTFTTCYAIPSLSDDGSANRQASDGWGGGPVPIGPAISGTTVYLLDDDLQPVPAGETGTLWTGGLGVALGYLNLPEMTQERFRADPFSRDPERRMYCTGDLAFLRPDGAYSFVGRADRQVKISGKRIELDAVEAVFRDMDHVREAVAVARPLNNHEREIVAFVEPAAKPMPASFEHDVFKRYSALQPAYMVPARLIAVDGFALSPTGKIDRGAVLRAYEAQLAASSAVAITLQKSEIGQSKLARDISAIWCRVLERDSIDPDANFFDLGGSSLRMIDVHASLQKLVPGIPITTLFSFPSLAALITHLEADGARPSAIAAARHAGDRQKMALHRVRLQTKAAR